MEQIKKNFENGMKLIAEMEKIFKPTSKYSRGKIYKIIGGDGSVYYGSTYNTLNKRLSEHRSNFKRFSNGNRSYTTSFKILEQEEYYIKLVENYPCNNKRELLAREGYYIRNNDCVNKAIAGRTKKEYNKQYDKNNKEKILETKHKYRLENADKFKKYNKQYDIDNKDKIKARKSKVCTCECGSNYSHSNKNYHIKSAKHQNYINNL